MWWLGEVAGRRPVNVKWIECWTNSPTKQRLFELIKSVQTDRPVFLGFLLESVWENARAQRKDAQQSKRKETLRRRSGKAAVLDEDTSWHGKLFGLNCLEQCRTASWPLAKAGRVIALPSWGLFGEERIYYRNLAKEPWTENRPKNQCIWPENVPLLCRNLAQTSKSLVLGAPKCKY